MVTWIGSSSAKVIISDNATPANGTYALGITPERVKGKDGLPFLQGTDIDSPGGIGIGNKAFIIKALYTFSNFDIASYSDWENLLKAIGTWEKNSTVLYLSVKNEWGSELAYKSTYSTPTTLVLWRGKSINLDWEVLANSVRINSLQFIYKRS